MARGARDTFNQPVVSYTGFLGKKNTDDPSLIGPRYVPIVQDVDNHVDGRLLLRPGQTLVDAGAKRSLWSNKEKDTCLYMKDVAGVSYLMRLNSDESSTVIASGFTPGAWMSFAEGSGRIWMTNNFEIGYLENGVFHSSFTEQLDDYKIYPIAGHLIEFWNGRLFVARGADVFFSDGHMPWQFDLRHNFIPFNKKVSLFRGVDNGIWAADGKIKFLAGKNVEEGMLVVNKADYDAMPYSDVLIHGDIVGPQGMPDMTCWFNTAKGVCMGGSDGSFRNLSDRKTLPPPGQTGASLFRQDDGLNRFITVNQI